MSLLDEDDAELTLQVSPGALLEDELGDPEPRVKEKKEKKKGGGLSLGRPKPKEILTEKASKKGKHVRNKSGSRTPPDSPRAEGRGKGGRHASQLQPSPNVKSHRKRYSQLAAENVAVGSDEEQEEINLFANQVKISNYHNYTCTCTCIWSDGWGGFHPDVNSS